MHHHDDSPDIRAERDAGLHLRQLLDVTAALGGATTLDEAARLVVERGISAVGASGGSLSVVDERAAAFEMLHARGLPAASVRTFHRFPLQAGRPLSDAVLSRASVFLRDSSAWETRYPEMAPAINATGAGALALVPVSTSSGIIAGLCLAWPVARGFDDATQDFLSALGVLCGQAIERALLARSARESRAEADAAITQLREQAAGLEQALDQARSLTRELEREREDLAAVLDVVPVGIGIARDPECRDVRVNPAFARQLGIRTDDNASKSAPDTSGLPFHVFSNGHEVPADQLPMQIAAREQRVVSDMELDIVHDDGRVTRLLEYAAPLVDHANRVRGAVGAFVDITERTALVEAERAARAAAEEASLAKTHLLSVLSHELRTPVNSVMAHAQLIEMGLHGPVSAEQREALQRIHRSAQHLTGLITDLLNLARIEQGRVTYDLRAVPVGEMLAALAGLLEPQAAEKELALTVAPVASALLAIVDADRLQQILINLVGNAIKFTERGGRVTLGAARDGDTVRITVTDTGSGIPADHLDVIFDRFVQVDPALTRRTGGMGLGLSISRDLARGMGGELSVESMAGRGSTFTLTLPLAAGA